MRNHTKSQQLQRTVRLIAELRRAGALTIAQTADALDCTTDTAGLYLHALEREGVAEVKGTGQRATSGRHGNVPWLFVLTKEWT